VTGDRVYPEAGRINNLRNLRRLIRAIERDRIPRKVKRQRLQFMYSLTYSDGFKSQFKDSIREARRILKQAYSKYTVRGGRRK
jgi:hypothetical protein